MCHSNCSGCGRGHWGGCTCSLVIKILLIIGGINWGLVGIALLMGSDRNWNVVNLLLGSWPVVEGIVYILVGIAAVMKIFGCKCKKCMAGCDDSEGSMKGSMESMEKKM